MNRADVRELECFVAVADHLNFSRAARQLHVTQPPLTRRIQALEGKLGSRLFERDTHAVTLTAAGRLYLEDARTVLQLLDRAAESLRRARQGETARLRLAFVGALLDGKLVELMQRFRAAHPDCQVEMNDLSPTAQLEGLRAGELDGGFIGAHPAKTIKGLTCLVWNEEPLVLALPERHPLAAGRPVRWAQLRGLPWVMVSRGAAPAFRRQFAELAEQHGLAANIVQESERVPAVLTMVAAGGGVTLVPAAVEHLITKGVVFRRLPAPAPILRHTFAYRTDQAGGVLKLFLPLL